jgi:lipoate-protein ligase A
MKAVLFEALITMQDSEPHSAALNMAIDEALLQRATRPTLRLYAWERPALSLGYFSRHAEAEQAAAGRELVRRWTGGGLVEHGQDLTYTLLVPRTSEFFQHSALESYRLIHEALAGWLAGRGVRTQVAACSAQESSVACFAAHVRHDILSGPSKLAGAAQRRTRWGLLHQGSIQLPGSARVNGDGMAEAFSRNVLTDVLRKECIAGAEEIARAKYATREWLRKF